MILFNSFINYGSYIISKPIIKLRNDNLSWNISKNLYYHYHLYKFFYINVKDKSFKKNIIKIFIKEFFWHYTTLITKKI
jgi:hypothetical protein